MTELEYAAAWRKLAYAEGHRKKLPQVHIPRPQLKQTVIYARMLKAIREGHNKRADLVEKLGMGRQSVNDRLRQLVSVGKIEKVGSQWRVKE